MDAKKLAHYERLDRFIQERIREDIYPEPPDWFHTKVTEDVVADVNARVSLAGKKVLDCGSGQGVALEIFKKYGAQAVGTTFGEDYRICKEKGFEVYEMDQTFLDFSAQSFDLVWCRHALEHSLMPLFTLRGFYEVLKPEGHLYVEVPAPETSAHHERNKNHYSCFTKMVWVSLFNKANFSIVAGKDIQFQTMAGGQDTYHAFLMKKN